MKMGKKIAVFKIINNFLCIFAFMEEMEKEGKIDERGRRTEVGGLRRVACLGVFIVFSFFNWVQGQRLVSFSVPREMCAGSRRTVTFGYMTTHDVVVGHEGTTLGHSERIFLPDGVPCGTLGCSYRSHVNFTAFATGATITSVEDIKYVRVNMEHSWVGDIYIGVTCPNGQRASLLKYSNNGASSCTSTIPSNHRGWSAGNNVEMGTYLGDPQDGENSMHKCDSSALGNEHGEGWNYCWSNNTTSGYSYAHASASDDGIIYRYGHAHGGKIDSSDVGARTNFYHPDQNFSSLIGCPLNGDWYIEVLDGWSGDNGYIFEWELALNDALIPDDCEVEGYSVTGYGVTVVNDSTFTIEAPEDLTDDTTVYYTYHITSSCGEDIDSTVAVTVHPNYQIDTVVEGCGSCVWQGQRYTTSTDLPVNTLSVEGCDSIQMTHVVVHPVYNLHRQASVVENDLPYSFHGTLFYDDVTDTLFADTTAAGCDSNVSLTLHVARNRFGEVFDTVCASTTPYHWAGNSYEASTVDTLRALTTEGADSVVVLHLTVFPSHHWEREEEVVENDLPAVFCGVAFVESTDTVFGYTNSYGCDSTIGYRLTVWRNHRYHYRRTICDNELPYLWGGELFDSAGSVTLNLLDVHGADSMVTLTLEVNATYHIDIDTTICDNHPLAVGDSLLERTGEYWFTLTTAEGCDSVVGVTLRALPHDDIHIYDTVCKSEGYMFDGVYYDRTGVYPRLFVNRYGCDSLVTLHLGILREELKAEMRVVPQVVTLSNLGVDFYDCSHYNATCQWVIEGDLYGERHVEYTYPVEADSLPVTLVAISEEGCTDTARGVVVIDRSAVFTPNVFTPGESTNNTWQPVLQDVVEMELWIYNREGLLVCHLEGVEARWDGTRGGEPCPQGAYVYTLQYRTRMQPEKRQKITGTILLLR